MHDNAAGGANPWPNAEDFTLASSVSQWQLLHQVKHDGTQETSGDLKVRGDIAMQAAGNLSLLGGDVSWATPKTFTKSISATSGTFNAHANTWTMVVEDDANQEHHVKHTGSTIESAVMYNVELPNGAIPSRLMAHMSSTVGTAIVTLCAQPSGGAAVVLGTATRTFTGSGNTKDDYEIFSGALAGAIDNGANSYFIHVNASATSTTYLYRFELDYTMSILTLP